MGPVSTSRSVVTILGCFAAVFLGCASSTRVEIDPSVDFDRYRTWGWHFADASDPVDASYQREIATVVAAQVDRVMSQRGYEFAKVRPDLLVTPTVRIRRTESVIHTALPDQFLPSLHSTPSYLIESRTIAEPRIVEMVTLRIEVFERTTKKNVWTSVLRGVFEGSFASEVGQSVDTAMARFPTASEPGFDALEPAAIVRTNAAANEDSW